VIIVPLADATLGDSAVRKVANKSETPAIEVTEVVQRERVDLRDMGHVPFSVLLGQTMSGGVVVFF
jgi:hypothetical protein